jgi:hypothetical protein
VGQDTNEALEAMLDSSKVQSTMTKAIQRALVALCSGILVLSAHGQVRQESSSNPDERGNLPRMQDWFLSTGDWHKDPQLCVREFGYGSETIVMLHGGWGAEHSGLVEAVKDLEQYYRFVFYDQRGSLRFAGSLRRSVNTRFDWPRSELFELRPGLGYTSRSVRRLFRTGLLAFSCETPSAVPVR